MMHIEIDDKIVKFADLYRTQPINTLLCVTANAVGFDLPKQGSPLTDLERADKVAEKILVTATM